MECFVIFVVAWCWFNATESKPQNVVAHLNKMQKSITIILLLIFNLTIGQEKVDPTESLISELKKELNGKNITDFFVVKQITYGTAYIFDLDDPDSCNPNGIYFTMYAFWKDGKDDYVKKFDNCGGFNSLKLSDSKISEFYLKNSESLKSDEVKSYQIKPDSIANGKIYKSISHRNHQPQRYFLFYINSEEFRNHFDKYDLTTEKDIPNLNYKSNNELSIVKLNAICEEIINDLNNKSLFNRQK